MNCPHCGSASRSDWGYECGSSSSVGFERSIRCRTKEMSNIRQEIESVKDRIKRLEGAGDKLSDCADQIGWTSCESPQWIKKAENAVKEWHKAKEAKP